MEEKYLILGIKNKNEVVFDFVFNYYYSGLCAYSKHWTDDSAVAEDIVQDFFVFLWINSSKLEITSSLKSYFFISVKNRTLNYLKHEKVKEQYKNEVIKETSLNYTDWTITESELTEIIEKAIQKLPPRCREIFKLNRIQGKNNGEIAEKLGLSKRTVELQISNALKFLRVELKPFLPSAVFLYLLK